MSSIINFSGGRTSGMLLWGMLQDGLPADTKVVFCNTGKEHEATLEFVHECSSRWGVEIIWLEWTPEAPLFKQVTFKSAARNGEPFEALIKKRKFLPNVAARFCTQEMKIKTARRYCLSLGWEEWDSYVGIRADEPRRVARIRSQVDSRYERFMPLADHGINKEDVLHFWSQQPFDLKVPDGLGNCDMCFLKGKATLKQIAESDPRRAVWWANQERLIGATFIKSGLEYRNLAQMSCAVDDAVEDCTCTD